MSFLSESNRDAYSVAPDKVATGPLTGFFESFSVSRDLQMKTAAQFGIENAMQEIDWAQTRAMLDAGVVDAPQLMLSLEGPQDYVTPDFWQIGQDIEGYYDSFTPSRSGEYLDVARRYEGQEISPEFEERLQAYDARVLQIRDDRPDLDLKTSREMFGMVKENAQVVERQQANNRRSFGGVLGDFTGGMVGAMHPSTDPLNFYTLPVGGAGRTALARIGSQAGAQGTIEALNQVTGVQEQRSLLGLSTGFQDAAMRVGFAAVAGGVLQGAGEGIRAGAKRWFRNTPEDPAPPAPAARTEEPLALPPPSQIKEAATVARIEQDGRAFIDLIADELPLSGIRAGKPRTVADLADVSRQLNDWAGGDPAFLVPRTENARFPGTTPQARLDVSAAMDSAAAYRAAKAADPDAFTRYEKLLDRKSTYRRWIDELTEGRDVEMQATIDAIDVKLHGLEARLQSTQGKGNKAKIRSQIKEARADRQTLLDTPRNAETPDVQRVRKELVKADEKMRDLAPLMGRAYSRTRGQWGQTTEELEAVWAAYRAGRTERDVVPASNIPDYDVALTLTDKAPILARADKVEAGATSADTAQRIIAEDMKLLDQSLERYKTQVASLLDVSEGGKIRVEGREYEFDIDKDTMFVPHESGTGGKEVSMREFLEDTKRAGDELEAVSTCSIR